MKLSGPKRRIERPVAREALSSARATITRTMAVALTSEHVAHLDLREQAELVALARRIEQDEDGQRSTNLTRLSAKELRRLETLIEAGIEAPGHFAKKRQQADTAATLEALAVRARRPGPCARFEESGAVILPRKWAFEFLRDGTLWLEHVTVLVLLLTLFENQEPVTYGISFEEGGEVIALDTNLFLGGDIDPD
jgi:hypothetical protein